MLQILFEEVDFSKLRQNKKECQDQMVNVLLYLDQHSQLLRECRAEAALTRSVARFVESNWGLFENKPVWYALLRRTVRGWTRTPWAGKLGDMRAELSRLSLVRSLDQRFVSFLKTCQISECQEISQILFIESLFRRYRSEEPEKILSTPFCWTFWDSVSEIIIFECSCDTARFQ